MLPHVLQLVAMLLSNNEKHTTHNIPNWEFWGRGLLQRLAQGPGQKMSIHVTQDFIKNICQSLPDLVHYLLRVHKLAGSDLIEHKCELQANETWWWKHEDMGGGSPESEGAPRSPLHMGRRHQVVCTKTYGVTRHTYGMPTITTFFSNWEPPIQLAEAKLARALKNWK